jgi:hypothetical protein
MSSTPFMFCKNIKKRVWEMVFFGIVFVLWLVTQGSPPPSFYLQNHDVVEKRKEGWKLSNGSVTLGPFFLCGIAFLNTPVVNC